ncbi:MAG: 5-bromo-4-chloroindolyl phosphate hydrolysis family protein [Thiotrichaceae bacterium]
MPKPSTVKRINSPADVVHEVRYGLKGVLLYFLPLPVLIAAIVSLVQGNFWKTIILAASFTGFMLAAIIARHGLKIESTFERKKFAKAPGTPYKTVAAIILGSTTALTAYFATEHGLFSSLLTGAAALLGFMFSYGLDPRKDKTGNISLGVTAEEVIEALEAAEIKISGLVSAKRSIKNLDFNKRLDRIIAKARDILAVIEEDPRDLQRARKFLKVYLTGAERVAQKYAQTHKREATTDTLDENFGRVLDSIEETFNTQHTKLKENDQFDLDVQIEVLETQLKREGIV